MTALLWKDYRLNRGVLLLGIALLLGPYAAVFPLALYGHWPSLPPVGEWSALLLAASFFSLGLSQLTLALLGGNSIAAERADRSAEFLAYLPPSRLQILASKLLLALLAAGAIWAVNLSVTELLVPALGEALDSSWDKVAPRSMLTAGTVLVFGASWLGSAVLNSPASATSLGIAVAAVGGPLLAQAACALFASGAREAFTSCGMIVGLTVGSLCFLSGSASFLRRVEP
jgi:ABC-type transport system involved in multi-copper enzyme maturation permease subunit